MYQDPETDRRGRKPEAELPLFAQIEKIRGVRRTKVYLFFLGMIGTKFASPQLHLQFGSSVRTRISEINRHPESEITIRNETKVWNGKECSVYWAERRTI